ncbi:MAG: DUF3078 domain-containing protein [Flavobacteriales bacterium]|nr:DUF3078 domain-containing protein [Flavobacteriales bacterium]
MKKIAFLLLSLSSIALKGQENKTTKSDWELGGTSRLNFSQVALSNWSAGGQNSLTLNGLMSMHAHKSKGKGRWENFLEIGYGTIKQGQSSWIKTDDRIDFTSKYNYEAKGKWYYAALLNFKTQLTDGYNYPNDSVKISGLFSPAYFLESFGFEYKANDKFSCYIAPVTLKATIVGNQDLANLGAFGVEAADVDTAGNILREGENTRTEFGGYIRIYFDTEVVENINLNTKLELFSNYLDKPQDIDVNWECLLSLKVNKFISATLSTQLIYDKDIDIATDSNNDGIIDTMEPKVQFKEVFGLGLTYTL